jgi:ribosomal protein L24E
MQEKFLENAFQYMKKVYFCSLKNEERYLKDKRNPKPI